MRRWEVLFSNIISGFRRVSWDSSVGSSPCSEDCSDPVVPNLVFLWFFFSKWLFTSLFYCRRLFVWSFGFSAFRLIVSLFRVFSSAGCNFRGRFCDLWFLSRVLWIWESGALVVAVWIVWRESDGGPLAGLTEVLMEGRLVGLTEVLRRAAGGPDGGPDGGPLGGPEC